MNVAFHVPTTLLAGLLGMVAMEIAMWLITRSGWAQGNMIVALGSLFTRTRQNAFGVGLVAHTVAAVFFAELYLLGMLEFGLVGWPVSLFTGIGFGLVILLGRGLRIDLLDEAHSIRATIIPHAEPKRMTIKVEPLIRHIISFIGITIEQSAAQPTGRRRQENGTMVDLVPLLLVGKFSESNNLDGSVAVD